MDSSNNNLLPSTTSSHATNNNSDNQEQQSVPKLCLAQCGFFGNAKTNWYCSKCFKELHKPTAATAAAAAAPATAQNDTSPAVSQPQPVDTTPSSPITSAPSPLTATITTGLPRPSSFSDLSAVVRSLSPEALRAARAEIVQPLPSPAATPFTPTPATSSTSTAAVATPSTSTATDSSPHKKIRCMVCRKKLNALQYQTCRCSTNENGDHINGREFCSEHRHTFSHECTFDVKKLNQRILNAANPEIKSNSGLDKI